MTMKNYDLNKPAAIVHYIIDAAPSGLLGKSRLNKILWFSDREMFLRHGKTISGETYLKFPQGPVCRYLSAFLDSFAQEKRIAIRKAKVYDYEQYEYISLAEPDLSSFTSQKIDVIWRQIDRVASIWAKDAGSLSHGRAWETANMWEEIPMYSVLADKTREITEECLDWALDKL
jgi:hypothetical protein